MRKNARFFGDICRRAREKAGLSLDKAAADLHIGRTVLYEKEKGIGSPISPETIVAMGDLYSSPEIPFRACHEQCPIGKRYGFEYLDEVDLEPVSVLAKLQEELGELNLYGFNTAFSAVLNKKRAQDLTDGQITALSLFLLHLLDVEQTIGILKLSMQKTKFIDIADLTRQHNQKCRYRGYIKKEAAYAAAN